VRLDCTLYGIALACRPSNYPPPYPPHSLPSLPLFPPTIPHLRDPPLPIPLTPYQPFYTHQTSPLALPSTTHSPSLSYVPPSPPYPFTPPLQHTPVLLPHPVNCLLPPLLFFPVTFYSSPPYPSPPSPHSYTPSPRQSTPTTSPPPLTLLHSCPLLPACFPFITPPPLPLPPSEICIYHAFFSHPPHLPPLHCSPTCFPSLPRPTKNRVRQPVQKSITLRSHFVAAASKEFGPGPW